MLLVPREKARIKIPVTAFSRPSPNADCVPAVVKGNVAINAFVPVPAFVIVVEKDIFMVSLSIWYWF